jgi:hypothetical protein
VYILNGTPSWAALVKPPWLNSKEGISDKVLAPWTPMRLEKPADGRLSVNCWGRRYDFACGPFPTSIVTAGKAMLKSPIVLRAIVDGKEVEWVGGRLAVAQDTPARVEFESASASADLALSAKTAIDYDGMIRVDCLLTPKRSVHIQRLALEIPLIAATARYVCNYPEGSAGVHPGLLKSDNILGGFCPYFWLGDEDRGLAWFCESEESWLAADTKQLSHITRTNGQVLLRLEIISQPVSLVPGSADSSIRLVDGNYRASALKYTFGFQATPVRPNPEDVWDWRINHGGDYGIEQLSPDAPANLRYPAEGNINLLQGTLEFYVKPLFDTDRPGRDRGLFSVKLPRDDEVRLFWPAKGKTLKLLVRHQQDRIVDLDFTLPWEQGKFYHMTLTWGDSIRVYRDGKLAAEAPRHGMITGSLLGGFIEFGGPGSHILIDEIRISAIARAEDDITRDARPTLDAHTLLLDDLNEAIEPGSVEHLDSGYGGYPSTVPEKCAGNWGWNGSPGGIIGLGRFTAAVFGNGLELGLSKPRLDYLADAGVKTLCFHEQWTDYEGYTSTWHGEKLRALVNACHARGMRLLLYYGFLFSNLAPEWPQYGDECVVEPRSAYDPYVYPPQPAQKAYRVCYRSVWQDALAAGIAKMMDDYGADGVYLDGTACPEYCTNRRHGCGYIKPDGSVGGTWDFFAVREMMRRIYTIVKTRKPDGQVNIHNSSCMTIPTVAWATSFWPGEQFGSIRRGPAQALGTLPLDVFRTSFMGRQWGVPAEFLCYDRPYTYDQASAFTLLHDVLVRANGLGPHLELESRLWKLSDEFGRKQSEWLPYWSNSDYVKVTPPTAHASLYWHPKNGVLIFLANIGSEKANCTVNLDLAKLRLSAGSRAADALTGKLVVMQDGRVSADLDTLGWKCIWIRP